MSFQSWDTRIDDDLALLSETLEEVLRSSGDPADQKYIELKNQFEEVLKAIDAKAKNLQRSNAKEAARVFWPVVQQLMIAVNKECDLMTPMELLANVQNVAETY